MHAPRGPSNPVSTLHYMDAPRAASAELGEVAAVQRHLLPAHLPSLPGYEFAALYRPCLAAGGDFFGFQHFSDGRLGFVVADVSGHGAGAAVMMAVLRTALAAFRVFARERKNVGQDINSIVNEVAVPGIFVTAFFVSLDPGTGDIYCGNCGHPAAILRRVSGMLTPVDNQGSLPLGIIEEIAPPMISDRLNSGEALVLYTDGITDARGRSGALWGENALRIAIRDAGPNAVDIVNAVRVALDEHEQGADRVDDQCLLVVSRR